MIKSMREQKGCSNDRNDFHTSKATVLFIIENLVKQRSERGRCAASLIFCGRSVAVVSDRKIAHYGIIHSPSKRHIWVNFHCT